MHGEFLIDILFERIFSNIVRIVNVQNIINIYSILK